MTVGCNPRRVYLGELRRVAARPLAQRPIAAFRAGRMDER